MFCLGDVNVLRGLTWFLGVLPSKNFSASVKKLSSGCMSLHPPEVVGYPIQGMGVIFSLEDVRMCARIEGGDTYPDHLHSPQIRGNLKRSPLPTVALSKKGYVNFMSAIV